MQKALVAADQGRGWIYFVIAALVCVLAIEAVCIIFFIRRMRAAQAMKKAGEQKDGTSLSGFATLALAGGVLWSGEVWMILLAALTLCGAVAIAVLFAVCLAKGYLFVPRDEAKEAENELRKAEAAKAPAEPIVFEEEEPEEEPEDATDDADRAVAAFAETESEPEAAAEEPGEAPAEESTAAPEPVAEEPEAAAEVSAAESEPSVTRVVETYVTETVRETVREREAPPAAATLTEPDDDADEPDDADDDTDPDSETDFDEENELNDPDHFTGNERVIGFDEESGCYIVARYRKSFEAKLIQSQSHIKKYYSGLKNALLAWKGSKSRMSWTADSFHNGRAQIAKINVKTRILELYLALDPATLEGSVYRGQDVGALKKYEETPFRYKIRTPRKYKWALELVNRVCEEHGLSPIDIERVDYEKQYPFDTIDHLVERKLIKVTTRLEKPATTFELLEDHEPDPSVADEEAVPASAAAWEYDNENPAPTEAATLPEAQPEETVLPAGSDETTSETERVRETVRITQIRYTERYGENGEPIAETRRVITDAPADALTDEPETPAEATEPEPEPMTGPETDPLTAAFGEAHPENLWSEETTSGMDELMGSGAEEAMQTFAGDQAQWTFEEPAKAEPEPPAEEYEELNPVGNGEDLADLFTSDEEDPTERYHAPQEAEPEAPTDATEPGSAPEPEPEPQETAEEAEPDPFAAFEEEESLASEEPSYADPQYDEISVEDFAKETSAPEPEPKPEPEPVYQQPRYGQYEQPYDPYGGAQNGYAQPQQYGQQPYVPQYSQPQPQYNPQPRYNPPAEPRPEPTAQPEPPKKKQVDPNLALIDVALLDVNFRDGDYVNLEILKRRGLAMSNATKLKVRASRKMRHALIVAANQFTYDAILAIGEAGGEAQYIR